MDTNMTHKQFVNIIIVSVLLIIAAVFSVNLNSNNYNFKNRDEVFLKKFTKNINNITTISIESFDNTIDLVKNNNTYISESGYPLKKGLWENLVTSLSLLRIEEKKTNDPTRHADLNLISPELNKSEDESEGYATKITLKNKDGSTFSSILFGKTDPSVGGLSGGQFARIDQNNQSFLLKGAIRMPTSKSDWFESLLFTIKDEDFKNAILYNKDKIFEVNNVKDNLKLTFPKTINFELDESKLSDVRNVITSFYFYDVKKSSSEYSKDLPTLSYETKDGLKVSISSVEPKADGESWVIVNVESKSVVSEKLAQEIKDKTLGFEFLANINTSDILRWNIQDLAGE
jgi:hypothetical protein